MSIAWSASALELPSSTVESSKQSATDEARISTSITYSNQTLVTTYIRKEKEEEGRGESLPASRPKGWG
jgi:hypothetical protein